VARHHEGDDDEGDNPENPAPHGPRLTRACGVRPLERTSIAPSMAEARPAWPSNRQNGANPTVPNRASMTAAPPAAPELEARFRSIFEGSVIGIALVGMDGRPQRCNAALERMLGYSEAELQQLTFAEFTHPEDVEIDLALFKEVLDGDRDEYRIDKRYIRKDGRV